MPPVVKLNVNYDYMGGYCRGSGGWSEILLNSIYRGLKFIPS